jgi:hypothetical protein
MARLPAPAGEVAEWLKAADCKSARASVRWFESSPLHHPSPRPRAGIWCGFPAAALIEIALRSYSHPNRVELHTRANRSVNVDDTPKWRKISGKLANPVKMT